MPYTFPTIEIELIDNFTIYVPRKGENDVVCTVKYIYSSFFVHNFKVRENFKTVLF